MNGYADFCCKIFDNPVIADGFLVVFLSDLITSLGIFHQNLISFNFVFDIDEVYPIIITHLNQAFIHLFLIIENFHLEIVCLDLPRPLSELFMGFEESLSKVVFVGTTDLAFCDQNEEPLED